MRVNSNFQSLEFLMPDSITFLKKNILTFHLFVNNKNPLGGNDPLKIKTNDREGA